MSTQHDFEAERCTFCGINFYDWGDESPCVEHEPVEWSTETPSFTLDRRFHKLSDAEVYETARCDGTEIIECNDDFVIDLVPMLFNWRIHVTMREDYGNLYLHGYCYFGRDLATRERARNAALAWARTSALDTKPEGYDKEAF